MAAVPAELSPAEVMRRGSFGGTYFRKIFSSATGEAYTNAVTSFPMHGGVTRASGGAS